MPEFRLTQISDTHLARRLSKLTDNFHRVSEHIDATRPDLVINSGDLAFDGPTSRDDLAFARTLHDALPVPCRYLPGNHDIGDNPTAVGPAAVASGHRTAPASLSLVDRRRPLALRGSRLVFHRPQFAGHEHRACQRGRAVRLAGFRARAHRRQAGRAVPAQAALSQRARRSRACGIRDTLRAAAGAAPADRHVARGRFAAGRLAAMSTSAAISPMAVSATSGRRRPASSFRMRGRNGSRSRKPGWWNTGSQPTVSKSATSGRPARSMSGWTS